jgi:predicted double-glycine peptidase
LISRRSISAVLITIALSVPFKNNITTNALANQPVAAVKSISSVLPAKVHLAGVNHVKQLPNYCGPASLSMVLSYWGKSLDQKEIANTVYDRKEQATNGSDLLLYARELGFSAYSINSTLEDVKRKLAAGVPLIVQQYFSPNDNTNHMRVVVGYNDSEKNFVLSDPEEQTETKMSYAEFGKLWQDQGNWALVVVPTQKDPFKEKLVDQNPVLHMDLAYAYFKKNQMQLAEQEAKLAMKLVPANAEMSAIFSKAHQRLVATGGNHPKAKSH